MILIQLLLYPFHELSARKISCASLINKVFSHLACLRNLASTPIANAQKSDRGEVKLLFAEDIHKSFPGAPPLNVLRGISLQVSEGETIAIMGKSGEGKSTLLHILGTLEAPSKGNLYIGGKQLPKEQIAQIRNQHIGLIFQSYHLLDDFTVLDNVLMPLKIRRKATSEPARALLKEVGLEDKESVLAKYLSGGEKQRVAIARALVNGSSLLLADEPTGNLDNHYSQEIQDLLLSTAKKRHTALIVVTHDEEFARKCDRLLLLKEGQLYNEAR